MAPRGIAWARRAHVRAPIARLSVHLPGGRVAEPLDLLAERSLTASWRRRWEERPRARVLFADETGWLAAAELEERTAQLAGRLAAAGAEPGDRLLLSAGTSADLVLAHVAALRLGLVVVPVNTAYREREIAHVVRDCTPALALVDDDARGRWIEHAAAGPVRVLGPDVAVAARGAAAPELDATGPHDPALIVYTSGTTGTPKGALLSHGNLLAGVQAVRLAWRWAPDDRLVCALPLFHVHGLGVGLHGTLTAGASIVVRRRFEPDDALDAIRAHGATLFFGVPTMYARLARGTRLAELGALRLCVSGSAPLPVALHREVATTAGQAILERYGMSETLMNTSNPDDGERRPGTVGLPLPGVELRLDDGGEIVLRGPNVFTGYWNRPEASAEAFAGGWFRSGDLGAHDPDGYLRIVGRAKELIISGGYNVYPREIEEVLREHPGVFDAAVVGAPHPDWGEQVVAYVEGDAPAADLAVFAAERLAPYKRPKLINRVDSLPRNALGKVVKTQLGAAPSGPPEGE